MMKKVIWSILIFLFTFSPLLVHAEEVKYGNLVTDESTIEEDFELLGLNIDDWYKPTKYDYNKWYVIAMSEAYVDDVEYDIQTYFYLYNPVDVSSDVRDIDLDCIINGIELTCQGLILSYNSEHLIYKIKGLVYDFCSTASIEVLEINYNQNALICESDFTAVANHSKINGFDVELSFNSMLVIEDFLAVEEDISQDNTFRNWWNTLDFPFNPTNMLVYFYNFNFPKHIEYDKVTYAKFQYDLVEYKKFDKYDDTDDYYIDDYCIELSRDKIIEEYEEGNKTLRVNDTSMELTFPTFYLGNRVKDKQFGTLEVSNIDDFDYDCSILLGSTYKRVVKEYGERLWDSLTVIGEFSEYEQMDEIEILELHYENDGILYKCQVAGGKVDTEEPNEDFGQGNATDPDSPLDHLFDEDKFLGKVMNSVKDWFNGIWQGIVNWFKDMYLKYKIPLLIIGGIVLGGLLFVIFKNLFVVAKFLWTIVYGIGYIIFYPFILIYRAIDNKKNE